ncbi:MAG: hypothetical protein AAGF12_14930 [Myxococcota bacterium]
MDIRLILGLIVAVSGCGDDEEGATVDSSVDATADRSVSDSSVDATGMDGDAEMDASGMAFTEHTNERFPNPRGCCEAELNIAVATNGVPRIFGYRRDGSDRRMFYLVRNGDSWDETNITEDGALPRPFSKRNAFALGPDDSPHGLFSDTDDTLYYTWLDGTWQSAAVGADSAVGNQFTHFDLAIDASGNAHVVWYDQVQLALRYGAWNGTGFDVETVDMRAPDDRNGEYARIAIASDGTLHISYLAIASSTGVLRHARGARGNWTIEDVPGMASGVHGSMRIDANNNPHIVSTGLEGSRARGLYWSAFDGSSWTETSLATDPSIPYADVDAALDSAGRPWVLAAVSIGGSGYPQLFYPLGAGRETYQIRGDVIGDVPESVAIALDATDTPRIAIPFNYVTLQ